MGAYNELLPHEGVPRTIQFKWGNIRQYQYSRGDRIKHSCSDPNGSLDIPGISSLSKDKHDFYKITLNDWVIIETSKITEDEYEQLKLMTSKLKKLST